MDHDSRRRPDMPPSPEAATTWPPLYSWAARDGQGRGAGGVTEAPDRATELLSNAIGQLAPGASGSIQIVHFDPQALPSAYLPGPLLLRMHRDPVTGVRVLELSDVQ